MGVTVLAAAPAQAAGETVVSLTFDDANADQMPAAQMLSTKGLPGTFFINSGFVDQPGWMSTADLATLAAEGHEIGGHTRSHPDLTQVPQDEVLRQICNDRVTLSNMGYQVTSFAYPFASANASVEAAAASCGYNSARGLGDLRTAPGTECASCDFAESIPPADPYWTRAADQVDATWTLQRLQQTVTDAAANGGGWVQLTFHHVCDGCDDLAISTAVFDQFTTWLAGWKDNATKLVKTVNGVVGGAVKPLVSGPAFVPPPAAGPGVNALQNPGFEEIAAAGIPRCWWDSSFGLNTSSFATVSPGRTGTYASQVTVSGYTTGDAKRLQIFDGGACAPTVVEGQTYSLRSWYKATGVTQFTVYYRQTDGSWIYGTSSPWFAAATDYTQALWTTPAIPAGVNGISFALNVFGNGELTTDDYSMYNTVGAPATDELVAPAPTITGTAQVGSVLTANAGTWTPAPVTLAYQWLVANVAVPGATAATYTPVAGDVGKTVTVQVTGTKTGYVTKAVTSAATAAVAAAPPLVLVAPTPTITGTARVGSVLTANAGTWTPAPVTLAYQWLVANVAVPGATAATYTPVAGDVGKTVTVQVTGTKTGYVTKAVTSAATAAVAAAPPLVLVAPTPTITGTARVGSVLTANAGTWTPAPVTLAYQWLVANVAVPGATAATYTPVAGDVGKTVTVRVTGTKTGYTTKAVTSAATAAVAAAPPLVLVAPTPTITGTARVGSVLTANAGTWTPAPVSLSYQWLVANVAVPGATAATYKPVAANVGKTVTVRVTGTKTGYTTKTVTSAATSPVAAAPTPRGPQRLAGADRFETSALVSAATFSAGVPVVYITTGGDYPDALSAGPAAGTGGGPVLLVSRDAIPQPVKTELLRLKPARIVVVGGTSVVSTAVQTALAQIAPTSRVAGADRFETSAKISAASFKPGVAVAYVAAGTNFPDALSGGAAAGSVKSPVLLVTSTGIPEVIRAELQRLKPGKVVILGGTDVVSAGVATALAGIAPTSRASGADRYATSAKISSTTFSPGVKVAYLVTGGNFPDALSAGSAAIVGGGPVLLVQGGSLPTAIAAELSRLRPQRIVVLGGPVVVSEAVLNAAQTYVR
ncbi:Putative cell wall binding repeat 2 [Microterricola viridarii]|uniref:Putative cell wall binding repeat 2 n=2 Tax=Microterricola viridarii TaxID=412690 RepID=A0A1H1XUZ2_9MICO|nr:Putative cell wall binding repeat 2 [Microterricola viridarii]